MTTSTENIQAIPVPIPARLDVDAVVPAFSKAMNNLDRATARELDRAGLSASLRELVRLRASQLNGCSYCVDVHGAAAIAAGEPVQRVLAVAVWRESAFFTARERAALAFTESVTLAAQTKVPAAEFALVAEQFSTGEVGALLALVVTINAWNAIGVAARAWEPTLAW